MTDRTRLVLVRHAEAIANTDGVLGGHQGCRGLSATGQAQAAALRDRIGKVGEWAEVTEILTSVLPRAVQTAEVLRPAVAGGAHRPVATCDLCDVHWGALDGRPADELRPPDNIYQPVAADGESWLGFERRARRTLRRLAQQYAGRTVLIVTHGGIVKASMYEFGGITSANRVELDVAYTGITIWSRATTADPWRLDCYNDHAHLPVGTRGR